MSSPFSKTIRSSRPGEAGCRAAARRAASRRGFSLFEMLISIAIFTLVTTLILVKNSQFQGNVLVTNLAYQTALAVREAQVYGVSVTGAGQNTGGIFTNFSHGYGVHIDASGGTHPTSFFLYADLNDNHTYDAGTDQIVETFNTPVGYSVVDYCITASSGGTLYCSDGQTTYPAASTASIATLDITFKRPSPNAYIYTYEPGRTPFVIAGSAVSQATITVTSNGGIKKTVQVTPTGQISVLGE